MTNIAWAFNPDKIQEPVQQVEFFGTIWASSWRRILEKSNKNCCLWKYSQKGSSTVSLF
jgi:hypothetical protein